MSASAERLYRSRGFDPKAMIGISLQRYAGRVGNSDLKELLEKSLFGSGLLNGDALLFRFVWNRRGKGHATVYEPIFEDGKLIAILNFITAYLDLPDNGTDTFELIETVRADDPSKAIVLYAGANSEAAARALRSA